MPPEKIIFITNILFKDPDYLLNTSMMVIYQKYYCKIKLQNLYDILIYFKQR